MRFSPGEQVTPNTQHFKLFGITEEVPLYPEFGKVYTVEGYNPNILCGHGRPVFYLKEFPPTYIFCETSFDPLPKLKLCDLPKGVSKPKDKAMKRKHVADSTLKIEPPKKWYPGQKPPQEEKPKKVFKKHVSNECPRCEGDGKVRDLKSGHERTCTCCGGKGTIA